jgi:hypothetical protein
VELYLLSPYVPSWCGTAYIYFFKYTPSRLSAGHAVYKLRPIYTGCHNQARSVPRAGGPAPGCSDSVLLGFPDSFQVNAVIIPSTGARCGWLDEAVRFKP